LFQRATRVPAGSPGRASRCVVRRDDPLPYDRRIDVGPCMASVWKSSGTASARSALFRCPCLWRCGRSKPLGAKLVEVVRDFAAHLPFPAAGVLKIFFLFPVRPATLAHYVLTEDGRAAEASHQSPPM